MTAKLPDLLESAVDVAVMTALPTLTPVTRPAALTLAMAGADEVQLTVVAIEPIDETVAVKVTFFPTATLLVPLTLTLVIEACS